jgi:hypothetical protein
LCIGLLVGLTALGLALTSAAPASADSNASGSKMIHNSDDLMRPATNVEFTVRLASWEGQNGGPYWFKTWNITTVPSGTMSQSVRTNGEGHVYAIDVTVTGLNIPYCISIRVDVDAVLNAWNSIVIDNVRFTYGSPGGHRKAEPNLGFLINDIGVPVWRPHTADYYFVNEDTTESVTLTELAFVADAEWRTIDEQWGYGFGVLVDSIPGPVTVLPGESLHVALSIPSIAYDPYIYIRGVADYDMPNMDPDTQPFRQGHQENGPSDVPASSPVGLLALALTVILTAFVFLLRRRRALS